MAQPTSLLFLALLGAVLFLQLSQSKAQNTGRTRLGRFLRHFSPEDTQGGDFVELPSSRGVDYLGVMKPRISRSRHHSHAQAHSHSWKVKHALMHLHSRFSVFHHQRTASSFAEGSNVEEYTLTSSGKRRWNHIDSQTHDLGRAEKEVHSIKGLASIAKAPAPAPAAEPADEPVEAPEAEAPAAPPALAPTAAGGALAPAAGPAPGPTGSPAVGDGSCTPQISECSFFFRGSRREIPEFEITGRAPGAVISPPILTHFKGQLVSVNVLESEEAEYLCNADAPAPDTQFYAKGEYVHMCDSDPATVDKYVHQFVRIDFKKVEVEVLGLKLLLEEDKESVFFPEEKRCIIFETDEGDP